MDWAHVMTLREAACQIAFAHYGKPYIWGGDDAIAGYDCSGFAQDVLRAVGVLSGKQDYTADALATVVYKNVPREKDWKKLRSGMLVFWERPDHTIRHVAMVWKTLADRILVIGASGGGSNTKTRDDAIRDNAFVKVSPLGTDWAYAVDPYPVPF